jgi:hypothetical protein
MCVWSKSCVKVEEVAREFEAERCKNEVDKCREEAEKYKSKLERQKMKLWLVERKYKFAFVCSWVIFLLLLVYPQSHRECSVPRMMLQ